VLGAGAAGGAGGSGDRVVGGVEKALWRRRSPRMAKVRPPEPVGTGPRSRRRVSAAGSRSYGSKRAQTLGPRSRLGRPSTQRRIFCTTVPQPRPSANASGAEAGVHTTKITAGASVVVRKTSTRS
jgi:hypothetical protein